MTRKQVRGALGGVQCTSARQGSMMPGSNMFEPVEGQQRYVRDRETGTIMLIKDTPEISTLAVHVEFDDGLKILFYIALEPKYKDKPYVPNDRSNPMIKLPIGDFWRVLNDRPASHDENAKLVRYLLSGLSAINRKWPLCGSPYFYSDLDHYKGREDIFPFLFPSNEELANL
jgi:hypothetical protein